MNNNTILVFAAHPDDEVLGCGGTIARYAHEKAKVHVVFFADGVGARHISNQQLSVGRIARRKAAEAAVQMLGCESVIFGDFPDNRLDSINMLEVVQFVEQQLNRFKPNLVFTHYANDLNIDHRLVHQAVVTACRPQPGCSVSTLLFFEVPSSTEWQPSASAAPFAPNWFVNITSYFTLRMKALEIYTDEMRSWPHARSFHAVECLTRWRGATVGVEAAEAFMLGRTIIHEK